MPSLYIFSNGDWHEITGSGGGGVGSFQMYRGYKEINTNKREVEVTVEEYDPINDYLLVFQNSALIAEEMDYLVEDKKIVRAAAKNDWISGTHFDFIVLKGVFGAAKLNAHNGSTQINFPQNQVQIPILDFNKTTDIMNVYRNSAYMKPGRDYEVSSNSRLIIRPNGEEWPAETVFDFSVIKQVKTEGVEGGWGIGGGSVQKIVERKVWSDINHAETTSIPLDDFDQDRDLLMLYQNSVFLAPELDYVINSDNTITRIWDTSLPESSIGWDEDTILDFVIFRNVAEIKQYLNTGEVQKIIERVEDIPEGATEVDIPVPYNSLMDHLLLFQSSVLAVEDKDYGIQDNKVVKLNGDWGDDTVLDFIILRNIGGIKANRFLFKDDEDPEQFYYMGVSNGALYIQPASTTHHLNSDEF